MSSEFKTYFLIRTIISINNKIITEFRTKINTIYTTEIYDVKTPTAIIKVNDKIVSIPSDKWICDIYNAVGKFSKRNQEWICRPQKRKSWKKKP